MIWIIAWPELLANLIIKNKISIILKNGLQMHHNFFFLKIVEKSFCVLTHLAIPFLLYENNSAKSLLLFLFSFDVLYYFPKQT